MSDRDRLTRRLWDRLVRELWLLRCELSDGSRTTNQRRKRARAICQKTRQVLTKSRKLMTARRR